MSDENKKQLFWVSWFQPTKDYRPLTFPPNENILGWWCSGERSDGQSSLCALVNDYSEDEAKNSIHKDWPEADEWRFCKEKDSTKLSDRFPLNDWQEKRINKFNETEQVKSPC